MKYYALIKSKKELEKYFVDADGDFWEYEDEFHAWDSADSAESDNIEYYVDNRHAGEITSHKKFLKGEYSWAVEAILTKEENPEYFL